MESLDYVSDDQFEEKFKVELDSFYNKNYTMSEMAFLQALEINKANHQTFEEGLILHVLGRINYELEQYERALDYYNQALALFQSLDRLERQAKALNNIGIVYDAMKEYGKAVETYQEALKISQQAESAEEEKRILHNLACNQYLQGLSGTVRDDSWRTMTTPLVSSFSIESPQRHDPSDPPKRK